jgi:hypothetical protein
MLVRACSHGEQNLSILEYARPDGEGYLRKERALTSFSDDRPVLWPSTRNRRS